MLEYELALWGIFLALPCTLSCNPCLLTDAQRFLKCVFAMAWRNKNILWQICMPWKNFMPGLKSPWPWCVHDLSTVWVLCELIWAKMTRSSSWPVIWRQLFLDCMMDSFETMLEHAAPCGPNLQPHDCARNWSTFICSLWSSKLDSISTYVPRSTQGGCTETTWPSFSSLESSPVIKILALFHIGGFLGVFKLVRIPAQRHQILSPRPIALLPKEDFFHALRPHPLDNALSISLWFVHDTSATWSAAS